MPKRMYTCISTRVHGYAEVSTSIDLPTRRHCDPAAPRQDNTWQALCHTRACTLCPYTRLQTERCSLGLDQLKQVGVKFGGEGDRRWLWGGVGCGAAPVLQDALASSSQQGKSTYMAVRNLSNAKQSLDHRLDRSDHTSRDQSS